MRRKREPQPLLYLTTRDIADAMGRPGRAGRVAALRWLRREGAATLIGRRWHTTAERIREAFPDLWRRIVLSAVD